MITENGRSTMKTCFVLTFHAFNYFTLAIIIENGGPINENVMEEEILEQLAKQQMERNWAEYREEGE